MGSSFGNIRRVREAQAAAASQFGGSDTFKHEMWALAPNEVIYVRFLGGENDPFQFHAHKLSRMDDSPGSLVCTSGITNEACPACAVSAQKFYRDKGICKKASARAAFRVFSCRPMLLIPTQRSQGIYMKREPLYLNASGQRMIVEAGADGKSKVSRSFPNGVDPREQQFQIELEGLCYYTVSIHPRAGMGSEVLDLDDRLSNLCVCGRVVGSGFQRTAAQVVAAGFTCGECGAPLPGYTEGTKVMCPMCQTQGVVGEPNYVCTAGCESPRPGGLRSCYVQVTRTGGGFNDTSYAYVPQPFTDIDPAHAEIIERSAKNLPAAEELYKPNVQLQREALAARGINIDTLMASMPGASMTMPQGQLAPSVSGATQPTVGQPVGPRTFWGPSVGGR